MPQIFELQLELSLEIENIKPYIRALGQSQIQIMNLSKEGTIISFNPANKFMNDKKEPPQQSGNALSGVKTDIQNPEPNMDPTQKDQEIKSNMRYLYEKIRDMQTKTKIITIFTILSVVILTLTIAILAGRSQTRTIDLRFQGKQDIPNTKLAIEHYRGSIKSKDGSDKDTDVNFSAQVVKPNTVTARMMQQDQQGSLSSSEQQNGDIATLTFPDDQGAIVIRATSPQDFEVQFSSQLIVRQLSRRFRGNVNWDVKVFRLLQQFPENFNEVDIQAQTILRAVASTLQVSINQLAVEQFDALKVTFNSDGTYTPQLEATSRLLPEAGTPNSNKLSDELLVQVGNMVGNQIVNRLQSVRKVMEEIIPSDFNNLDEKDSLGALLKNSNFNPEIDANVVQPAEKPSNSQSPPVKEQKKQEKKNQGSNQNNPSEKPADSSKPKNNEEKKQQTKPAPKNKRSKWWRNLKKNWNSNHKNRKNKKTVNASQQSFNKSKGCTDVNGGKEKICDVKALNDQKNTFKLKIQNQTQPLVKRVKRYRRRRIVNKKRKQPVDTETKKDKPNTDKPSTEQSDKKLTTQETKKGSEGN